MELKLWVDFWPGQVLIVGKGGEEVEETEEQVIEQLGSTNLKPPRKERTVQCTLCPPFDI